MFSHASVLASTCLSTGGVPISHKALQHFPECHGADTGGTLPDPAGGGYLGKVPPPPARSGQGGTLPEGVPRQGTPPSQVRMGGTLPRGYPGKVLPPGQVRMGGGTQLGQ